ncbi:MAG: Cold-shock DNA-binding domain [Rubrobacteraceae bacterium]|nr:Cold-shock DNA-binding domain [Rubrobacteraceae bacterium]
MSGVARGMVLWFSEEKGYGFIEDGTGELVLVHYTGIVGEGGEVEFVFAEDESRRRRAARVEAVG